MKLFTQIDCGITRTAQTGGPFAVFVTGLKPDGREAGNRASRRTVAASERTIEEKIRLINNGLSNLADLHLEKWKLLDGFQIRFIDPLLIEDGEDVRIKRISKQHYEKIAAELRTTLTAAGVTEAQWKEAVNRNIPG